MTTKLELEERIEELEEQLEGEKNLKDHIEELEDKLTMAIEDIDIFKGYIDDLERDKIFYDKEKSFEDILYDLKGFFKDIGDYEVGEWYV